MEKDYPLQYDGEFVLTKNGSKDFGEISQEMAREIHKQTRKIRLRRGVEIKGQKGNFGMKHIEREKRLTDLKIELSPAPDGDFYDVKTATPIRIDFFKNKTPLWTNQNGD